MKIKKLLSLMLCLSMLMSVVLTGCSEKKTTDDAATDETTEEEVAETSSSSSLSMYIVTDDETSEEQAKAVQLAINEITLKKLDVKVKINYVKADVFYETLEEEFLKVDEYEIIKLMEEAKKKKEQKKAEEEGTAAETEENTEGEEAADDEINLDEELDKIISDGDIILDQPQVDIIVFNDFDKFSEFVQSKRLAPLDEYLKLSSKQLKSYIYPAFLDAVKLDGEETFGIPVNGPIGKYEYFVFDMELANKYKFDINSVKSFADLERYLKIIKANEKNVVPLNKATLPANFEFYPRGGSPLGAFRSTDRNEWPEKVVYTYENEEILNHFKLINKFRKAGYLGTEEDAEGTRYAVQIREGFESDIARWEEEDGRDYECVVHKLPTMTSENALSSVFTISDKSTNKDKAMKLITLFNTNSELANLLQWGIENVHYYVVDKDDGMGTISLVNDSGYYMDNNLTGNKYIKYRLEGEPYEFEFYKDLNLNVAVIGAFAGFDPNLTPEDSRVFEQALAVTDEYYDDLIGGYGNFNEIIAAIKEGVKDLYSVSTFDKFITGKFGGPFYLHNLTLKEKYAIPEEEVVEGEETTEASEAEVAAE